MRRRRAGLCAAAVALTLLTACFLKPAAPVSQSFPSMGTLATVTVGALHRDRLAQLTAEVQAEFRSLENRLSTYQDDSEISQLSRQAGIAPVRISPHTQRVLELSRRYGDITGGAFDVTVAPLVRLWGFGGRAPIDTPEPEAIRQTLRYVDYHRIEIGSGTAFVPAGTSVDLGGIAKGYAVDDAVELAKRAGITAAMLDLGGNIRVIGRAEEGTDWTIGVRNPFERELLVGKVSLGDGTAVATSGNYERFVDVGGRRWGHILDPRTGYPVQAMASVTVVAPDASMSDALSTGLFVLGMSGAAEILRRCPGVDVILIPDRNPVEIWISPGMQKLFEADAEFASNVRVMER